jgi:hypothetical protein
MMKLFDNQEDIRRSMELAYGYAESVTKIADERQVQRYSMSFATPVFSLADSQGKEFLSHVLSEMEYLVEQSKFGPEFKTPLINLCKKSWGI